MPTDAIIVSLGVTVLILLFAGTLMWADRQTTSYLKSRQDDPR
jgi:hypothetical protein